MSQSADLHRQILTFSLLIKDLCWHSLIFFLFTGLGYFAAAGGLYWFFYLRRSSRFVIAPNKQTPAAIWQSVRSDVILSVLSSGIFSVCAALMMTAYQLGYTRLYLQPDQYGLGYLGFSLVLVLFLQDTYFYFTHRLSHHPRCYKWLHQGHHRSKNPTPWTAFAFDPAEAMVQAIYLVGITFIVPMHLSVLAAVVLVMTLGALVHHFGLRLFQASALGNWLGSWMVGPTHHWLHHRKYTVHYGLYFTLWDRLLGTQYAGYEEALTSPVTGINVRVAGTVPFPVPLKKAS